MIQQKLPRDRNLEQKWSKSILEHGFTAVPNLLFSHQKELGLSAPEFLVLVAIESFRWTKDNPWPSLGALKKCSGYAPRSLSRIITSLENKHLIKRIRRRGTSNLYSLHPLISRLDQIAISVSPPSNKSHLALDKKSSSALTSVSPKEYAAKKIQEKNNLNNGVEDIGRILKRKYNHPS
jgi:DNA-binding MarR family transcriptional regulator